MKHTRMYLLLLGAGLISGCGITDTVRNIIPTKKAGAAIPNEGEKVYFVVEERGMRRSKGYKIQHRSQYRSQPCIVTERVSQQAIVRNGRTFTTTIRRKIIEAVSGVALFASEVRMTGTERQQETVTISNGQARFETVGPGGTQRIKVKVPQGVMFGIGSDWLVRQKLAPNVRFHKKVLNRSRHTVEDEQVVIQGIQVENVLGEEQDVWVALFQNEEYAPQRMYFTRHGTFVRFEDEELAVRIVSRDEYEQNPKPVTVVSTVPIDFALPAWDNFTTLVFNANPPERWLPYLKSSSYAQIQKQGDLLQVRLQRTAPRVKGAKLPMAVPDTIRPYLGKSKSIMPHKFEIQQRARRTIRKETDVLRCVALLAGWVHQKIRFQNSGSLNPSPVTTIETGMGDCSEHADLFASLARSIGIPTRHCQGLLIQSGEAVYHAWVEAWIAGTWVPVDTTVNRVGLPAGYLLTARGTGDGEPRDEFAWHMRKGDLSLSLQQAIKSHTKTVNGERQKAVHTLLPNNKKTYLAIDDAWLANLYWGFALVRPDGWRGNVKDLTVSMTSPDGQGRAVIEGMSQPYHVDTSNLDLIVASLQQNMTRFRKIDARIISFGRRQAKAMLCDFTTEQDGRVLRCRQYIIPKRGRSFRIALWAPEDRFKDMVNGFKKILDSVEL